MHGILAQEGGPLEVVFGSDEVSYLWVILVISLLALAFAYYLVREVLAAPEGTEKMKEIARAIQVGARAYLSRQFRTVGIFIALLTIALFFVLPAPADAVHSELSIKFGRSVAFILGAGFSVGQLVRTVDELQITVKSGNTSVSVLASEVALLKFRVGTTEDEVKRLNELVRNSTQRR